MFHDNGTTHNIALLQVAEVLLQLDEKHGIELSLLNRITANFTPDSNAFTLVDLLKLLVTLISMFKII